MARLRKCRNPKLHTAGNCEALDIEIGRARAAAAGHGLIAVNIMRALSAYRELVAQACRSGADAIVMGAGLPFDLPELTRSYPDVALIPILSEPRGVRAVLKRWMRIGRLPDAIVIEHPKSAGGHLGATKLEQIKDPRFDFGTVMRGISEVFETLGLASERIPVIAAGGVNSHAKVSEMLTTGASAVQVGTAFAVTQEGDAHVNFKRVLARALPEDIVTFISSAGLPARAVLTPWLRRYLAKENRLKERADPEHSLCPRGLECLSHCGFKDGNVASGQFCIETQLAAAQRGDLNRGLFFRGAEALPFGSEIRPVRDLIEFLMTGSARRREASERTCAAGLVTPL
jgi:nitronate monooxygenase